MQTKLKEFKAQGRKPPGTWQEAKGHSVEGYAEALDGKVAKVVRKLESALGAPGVYTNGFLLAKALLAWAPRLSLAVADQIRELAGDEDDDEEDDQREE